MKAVFLIFKNLTLTNQLLVLLGVFGVPFCSYVIYDDLTSTTDPVSDTSEVASDGPSLLIPPIGEQPEVVMPRKSELYDESLERMEKWERGDREIKDPFKEIMDKDYFEAEGSRVETDSGKYDAEHDPESSKLESRYASWLAEKEVKERDDKSLTTRQTRERVEVVVKGHRVESKEHSAESEGHGAEGNGHRAESNGQGAGSGSANMEFSFYSKGGTGDDEPNGSTPSEIVSVVVHNDQEVGNQASLRVRLTESVTIGEQTMPENSIIWGNVAFGRDRVRISFTNIEVGGKIISFSREAYGKDGLEGIPINEIPGAGEVLKDAKRDGLVAVRGRSRVVRDLADGLDAITDSDKKIVFRDGYPFYLK